MKKMYILAINILIQKKKIIIINKINILKEFNNQINSSLDLVPVLLSGGSGSRLWPLSRESYPKQYLNLDEKNSFSLLQNTYLRLRGLTNLRNPIIISNEEQRFIVAEQMRTIEVKPTSIILEPSGKNTAPAIALSALQALKKYQDPTLLILSSDHKIDDEINFRNVIQNGLKHANDNRLVTFGIIPTKPETGYGYIESFDEINTKSQSSKIKKFIEKPNVELAKKLYKSKNYLWNSGIFLFKASTIIDEFKNHEPEIIEICEKSLNKGSVDLDFFRIDKDIFNKCPNIPIDIAVMEKTKLGTVLALQAGWDDIGSWNSVWENSEKDKQGNTLKGKVHTENTKNCYLRSEERLIVGIDLNDLIVVETNDAVLISSKDENQKIKKVVEELKKSNYEEGTKHKRDFRPWGNFQSIEKGSSWQVKKLELKPKASISLQMHKHRSEHWIIVDGYAKVEIDEEISFLNKNESIYIPLGSKHRLSNPGNKPLILIEVQSGNYLGEDDIVRFEDNYGRSTN